jgi:hypothetical protein
MDRVIPPIREPSQTSALLADRQSVDERGIGDLGSAGGLCAVAF